MKTNRTAAPRNVLVMDVGGHHVKVLNTPSARKQVNELTVQLQRGARTIGKEGDAEKIRQEHEVAARESCRRWEQLARQSPGSRHSQNGMRNRASSPNVGTASASTKNAVRQMIAAVCRRTSKPLMRLTIRLRLSWGSNNFYLAAASGDSTPTISTLLKHAPITCRMQVSVGS
jgi:hypothetical protein